MRKGKLISIAAFRFSGGIKKGKQEPERFKANDVKKIEFPDKNFCDDFLISQISSENLLISSELLKERFRERFECNYEIIIERNEIIISQFATPEQTAW